MQYYVSSDVQWVFRKLAVKHHVYCNVVESSNTIEMCVT